MHSYGNDYAMDKQIFGEDNQHYCGVVLTTVCVADSHRPKLTNQQAIPLCMSLEREIQMFSGNDMCFRGNGAWDAGELDNREWALKTTNFFCVCTTTKT
jgi:hypothetical protein